MSEEETKIEGAETAPEVTETPAVPTETKPEEAAA